jgi:hypothetical protein
LWDNKFRHQQVSSFTVITEDPDWLELRSKYDPFFTLHFVEFFRMYVKGNWGRAKILLETLDTISLNDGPTNALRHFMFEKCKGKCPDDWKGYRKLKY